MLHKPNLFLLIILALLVSALVMASGAGWKGPLSQTGMDMPTSTLQPGVMDNTATPAPLNTMVPVNTPQAIVASPTMTSIFTGFTPPPTGMPGGSASMGACGSSCAMGSASGMTGMGSMGATITGTIGTAGMPGMGSMGAAGMDMAGCPMMSGTGMTSSAMGSVGTGYDLLMPGMDMDESSSLVAYDTSADAANPWVILGWVVLGLLSLAIVVAIVFAAILLVRQLRHTTPA